MNYAIYVTPSAIEDIQQGLDFYNSRADNLGYRFADEVDTALQAIAKMPTAYGVRYNDVRGKQVRKFPYLIFYIINESNRSITVLRIFNGFQNPFWLSKE